MLLSHISSFLYYENSALHDGLAPSYSGYCQGTTAEPSGLDFLGLLERGLASMFQKVPNSQVVGSLCMKSELMRPTIFPFLTPVYCELKLLKAFPTKRVGELKALAATLAVESYPGFTRLAEVIIVVVLFFRIRATIN